MAVPKPPKFITKTIEKLIEPSRWEGISGDLNEIYLDNVEHNGRRVAKWKYTFQLLGFLRLRFRKKPKTQFTMRAIWFNYFLAAYRSLKRHRLYFGINLTGLVMAIACTLYALLYVMDEIEFNKDITKVDQIYRLYKHHYHPPESVDVLTAELSGMMAPTILSEFPEVINQVRVLPWWDEYLVKVNDNRYSIEHPYFVDSTFFDVFDYELLIGNPKTVLTAPSSIVLTKSLADKMFANENPIGKSIIVSDEVTLTVTGIIEDPPRQTSFIFDGLISWSTTVNGPEEMQMNWMNNWRTQAIHSYLLLEKGSKIDELVAKFPDMMERHSPERADRYFLKLQPYNEIYLFSDDIESTRAQNVGSIRFLYILGFSALLIFFIASINYINISLSRASQSIKEVGVRKVLGSNIGQLIGRILSETLISTLFATGLAVLLLWLILPELNLLTEKYLPREILYDSMTIFILLGYCAAISFVVGIYPAIILTKAPVSNILGKSSDIGALFGWFRKSLLGLQLVISVILLATAIIINQQTSFLKNKPLGFDKDQLVVLGLNREIRDKIDVFEADLLNNSSVQSVSICRTAIGGGSYTATIVAEGRAEPLTPRIFGVDQEYFETYGISTIDGRTFIKNSNVDSLNVVVNESFVKLLGWEYPIGKRFQFKNEGAEKFTIIGVIKDFHYYAPSNSKIEASIMQLNLTQRNNATLKLSGNNIPQALEHIENVWNKFSTETPFEYYFVDQWFDQQYSKEQQLLKITSAYSIISLVLCGLGLFGLTGLVVQGRLKEIGIRKVLGANMSSLINMINGPFMAIMLISVLVGSPIAYLLAEKWLNQFEYHISPGISAFLLAWIITSGLSIIIISISSIRAAMKNPTEVLSRE